MPLWKKAKCTRISKLVADHLQPPKHGGSLVVETGFPTSLVDLFVKNRDRLKKTNSNSKKKKKKRLDPIPDLIPTPSPSSSALDSNSELGLPSVCVLASERGSEIVEIEERGVVEEGEGEDGGCRCEVVEANVNGVFVAILKMFWVLGLALGTKKFVVGITMSAFLLLSIEYAGKHLYRLLKPCANAQRSLVGRCLCFVGIKREKCITLEGAKLPVVSDCFGLIENRKIGDCIQEIETLQPNLNLVHSWLIEGHKMNDTIEEIQTEQQSDNLVPPTGEIQSVRYELDLRSGEEKWVCEELGKKEDVTGKEEAYISAVVGLKTQTSHSGKISSKIKKVISNKLCGSKKKRMGSNNELSSSNGDHEVVMDEPKQHLKDGELCRLEYDDKSPSLSSEENGDKAVVVDLICSSGKSYLAAMDDSIVREDIGSKRAKNKAYLNLIVIVLVGLVWGRGLALAFALSWYLLLKLADTLKKFIKVPLMRSQ
ncbi:uncharacterized protein LOC130759684 [Actinidia eriantha]|uniref:uncharacterized protein LOC130759684 n=1 Tax=Actinidia eriantha TaxID=165200 RepID=UPI00258DFA72|nr:uncharacterized protein LOC130759684 [Actinidia eriantha]